NAEYSNHQESIELTEYMIRHISNKVLGTAKINYREEVIDLESNWKRVHMADAVKEATGVDFFNVQNDEEAKTLAKAHGVEITENMKYGHILNEFFEQKVEETLIQPTFVY